MKYIIFNVITYLSILGTVYTAFVMGTGNIWFLFMENDPQGIRSAFAVVYCVVSIIFIIVVAGFYYYKLNLNNDS